MKNNPQISYPHLSIITITYNSEKHLEHTIQSVINQTYQNKEYIVVDGASNDSTLNIIKKYENNINHWVSEPDNGIADAMNKGLKIATGDYILFLHSDDYLLNKDSLIQAAQSLDGEHDIFLFKSFSPDHINKILTSPRGLDWWINFKTGVLHQGTLCSRDCFKKIGHFDTNFSIAMDYDFFLRAYRTGLKSKVVDFPLSVMRKTGISSQIDWPTLHKRLKEEQAIHKKNCASRIMRFIYFIYWQVYPVYKRLQSNKV